ncbi:MAG TPA: flagellar basal body L-ring protein FlgH [Bryobacteraceae bacterium]|jgi:flagellar L-ring protein precursor FlgH|nr:flagellar basal body L-ring protein FlgH [Bryobacteraceae bacterium]
MTPAQNSHRAFRFTVFHATLAIAAALLAGTAKGAPKTKAPKPSQPSALDKYIQESLRNTTSTPVEPSPGSLWTPASRFTDVGSDLRAVQVNDLVTVVINEQASAVASGATQTSRVSSAAASISQLGGIKSPTGALANLLNTSNNTALNGSGTTSQSTSLTSTLSARVTHVLPNGYLVLEGSKDIQVNSEHQAVSIRGIIRTVDLSPDNVVASSQLAQMEIRIDGKGVVTDAVHRPNALYRFVLGLLPF